MENNKYLNDIIICILYARFDGNIGEELAKFYRQSVPCPLLKRRTYCRFVTVSLNIHEVIIHSRYMIPNTESPPDMMQNIGDYKENKRYMYII